MQAIENIIKIVRVLSVQFGHLLLVGVGGSGRKSLAQIGSFICLQNETFSIDQRQFQEEMQKLMRMVGVEQKATAFVFSDTQVEKESLLEDICNLLNNGEIPNLFGFEEKAKLLEDLSL
jgi:dynein heavy chain